MAKNCLLPLCLLFTGCFVANYNFGIPGSGKITTVSITAQDFTKVHHAAVGAMTIAQGDEESVSITTDDNLQQYLEAVVENGELIFRNKGKENLSPTQGIKIAVQVKSLSDLRMSGVGSLTATGLKGTELTAKSDGVGAVKLSGAVELLKANVDGVGNFDSSELEAKNVIVVSSGVGNTKVKATESIDAKATGVGNVTYVGNPQEKKVESSGIGTVRGDK